MRTGIRPTKGVREWQGTGKIGVLNGRGCYMTETYNTKGSYCGIRKVSASRLGDDSGSEPDDDDGKNTFPNLGL